MGGLLCSSNASTFRTWYESPSGQAQILAANGAMVSPKPWAAAINTICVIREIRGKSFPIDNAGCCQQPNARAHGHAETIAKRQ